MTEQEREQQKTAVVAEIIRCKGFKTVACTNVKLNPRTFRQWMADDAEFRQAVEDAVEIARDFRDDKAEQKLFEQVEGGDTTAIIFYCKTRLKNRGYTERALPQAAKPEQPQPQQPTLPEPDGEKIAASIQKRITSKKTYIVKLLKKQGKYTPELSMQVKITAQLLIRTEILAGQIFGNGHQPTKIELSREGNERESVSPKEKLYLDLVEQSQKALKALGMNMDSRERKTDNDGFSEFMEQFKNDGDE